MPQILGFSWKINFLLQSQLIIEFIHYIWWVIIDNGCGYKMKDLYAKLDMILTTMEQREERIMMAMYQREERVKELE